ncbi:MAG: L-aspartate oxidase [Bdellovibrionaceae bacterium]|nr:L-aspartate oxidase [Pseudobdellovibrionaceae bacterium]
MNSTRCDFLVIGSGLAGLAFALKVAHRGTVTILSKDKVTGANTPWAQGGIAAVISKDDSFESHIHDTLRAGAGLCRVDAVRNIVEQAPDRIRDLMNWGVKFDRLGNDEVDLTLEGGHSHRRILHFEDHTGSEIHRALLAQVLAHPNITVLENHFAVDLLQARHMETSVPDDGRVYGAYVLDRDSGEVKSLTAGCTILSTGGAGKVYLYTSNWSGASGDGIAMAWRAGAKVANMEFMQFHPTALYHQDTRNFLISEALRGEGGELINSAGEAFMKKYDERGSLAPRDIVARSIDAEMKRTGAPCVYLDMTAKPREFLAARFPVIYKNCERLGIDIATQPIPVVPAAHYLCGGVVTDVDGRTELPGLFALGETACTGLHGANRLASNSLLECLAMAHNCAETTAREIAPPAATSARDWTYPPPTDADEMIVVTHMWEEIRRLMWNYVGIVRSNKRLMRASHRLENILAEVKEYYSESRVHGDLLELRNIAIVADLTIKCALERRESRGIHYSLDYPWASSESVAKDTVLKP